MIKKRVLLVSYELSCTGSPKAVLNMANAFRDCGYFVGIWALNDGPYASEFEKEGYQVEIISFPRDAGELLDKRIRSYELVICHTIFCAEFACYTQRIKKTALYIHEAANIRKLMNKCGIDKKYLLGIRHTFCVSDYAKTQICNNYNLKNLYVLNNYVSQYDVEQEQKGSHDTIRLCLSGTVEERKGLDILVQALSNYLYHDIELHVIGEIPEWSMKYAEKWLDNDFIIYHGAISDRAELMKLYKSMDVFVVASRDESCSLVALEAAMLKKALIVTENTGAKYIVDNKACIVKTNDADSLSNAIKMFIKKPNMIVNEGKANYEKYLKYASENNYKKKLKKYIRKIIFSF
ncbi:glycosyltransferase family 4 protein [Pseudobutyrivibrio ruminis]|uniref:glycosyltransferase family 4 protein n=1 Tax=Pseudobutyrivibrio ruminis TaxID=46206 RepID=UPI00047F18D3|nr:glycosyltransferase family 4 protein [Pseudobutyrivibrio ruminis]